VWHECRRTLHDFITSTIISVFTNQVLTFRPGESKRQPNLVLFSLVLYYGPETSVGLGQEPLRDFGLQLVRRGFVTLSLGTCGNVTGSSRFLRGKNPRVKVVAVQPTEGNDVPGWRNISQLSVSKLFDAALIDDILGVDFRLACRRAD